MGSFSLGEALSQEGVRAEGVNASANINGARGGARAISVLNER